jgi:hypothetical protein
MSHFKDKKSKSIKNLDVYKAFVAEKSKGRDDIEVAFDAWEMSGKLEVLMRFLKGWREENQGHKVLLFS